MSEISGHAVFAGELVELESLLVLKNGIKQEYDCETDLSQLDERSAEGWDKPVEHGGTSCFDSISDMHTSSNVSCFQHLNSHLSLLLKQCKSMQWSE